LAVVIRPQEHKRLAQAAGNKIYYTSGRREDERKSIKSQEK
jgi:hypothetical protein